MKMYRIWDRARGNLKNHAMGKKSVGISFFSGYAHFVKWARSTGNFSILTSPPNTMNPYQNRLELLKTRLYDDNETLLFWLFQFHPFISE